MRSTPLISFEFFPPRTPEMEASLWRAVHRLEGLAPRFVSVTYGAGGSTRAGTHNTVTHLRNETGLEPAAHLTCGAASRAEADAVARRYAAAGVHHIVALRGGAPEGQGRFIPHPDGYANAAELVAGLKRIADFEISVAAFLEENVICTLATCSDNIPRSTPVRYRSRGLTIYILAEGGMKTKNIRENPRVSVSLYGPYSGFQSVKGLQLWGRAEIIKPGDGDRYREGVDIVNLAGRDDLKKLGIEKIQHNMKLIKIVIERARYINIAEGIFNQVLRVTEP